MSTLSSANSRPNTLAQNGDSGALSNRTLVALGLLDVSIILAYAFGVTPSTWYIGVLAFKLSLIVLNAKRVSISSQALLFAGAVIFGVLPGTLINSYVGDGITRLFGFCAQLILTATLIGSSGIPIYLRSVAFGIATAAVIHTAMCMVGMIPDHYGRFLYIGGGHPNLGSEIGAVGVLAAALALPWRHFIWITISISSSILLMQGRAAILAVMLIVAIRVSQFILKNAAKTPLVTIGAGFAATILVAALVTSSEVVSSSLSGIFMLNDTHRGLGTGFVGRSERWSHSIELFTQYYVFGVGASYFESRAEFGPHNYFLYGLTTMGILGFSVFFSVLSLLWFRVFSIDRSSAIITLGVFPLLMFNDRLLNLNPYPFLLYIILISFSKFGLKSFRSGF